MELDDLKLAWQTLDRRLEQQSTLSLYQFKEGKLAKVKSGLWPLALGQIVQLALGVLMMALFAPFWIRHIHVPHLAVYGISLHFYGLMLVVSAARDLHLISRIDYSAPVLAIQRQLAELRVWHWHMGVVFATAGCLVWVPLTLAFFYWLGADIWIHAPNVVYWLIASSLVCLALVCGAIHWSRRPTSTQLKGYIRNSTAGRGVIRAEAALAEIAQFENA